jgi:hypothetical protein
MSSEENRESLKGLENLHQWLEKFEEKNLLPTSVAGKSQVTMDIFRSGAAKMHRDNWDGCRSRDVEC